MLINKVYGRYASFFKSHELKEADKYIKRVFPNAEFYIDYEHALVFERIGEDEEIDLDYHTVINVLAYVLALGLHLGYSIEEIYNEYIRKNEINKERLANGY